MTPNAVTCYVCAAGHNCADHSRRASAPAPVVPVWATLAVSRARTAAEYEARTGTPDPRSR